MSFLKMQEHLDKAGQYINQARALLKEYEGKALPKDIEEKVDRLFDDAENEKKAADRIRREIDLEKDLEEQKKFLDAPERKHPTAGAGDGRAPEQLKAQKKAFEKLLRIGKKDLLEPQEVKALSSLTDPEGGVLISEDMRMELIRKRRDIVWLRRLATVLNTSKDQMGVPAFNYDANAEWTTESTQITEENIANAFGKVKFTPHKLSRIFRIPNEMREDQDIDIAGLLTDHFAMVFGEIEENNFINGNGVNKPLGLLQAGLNETQAETADTLSSDDIMGLPYDIKAIYRSNAAWLMNRVILKIVRKMKDTTGQYLWQPSLQAGQPPTLAGFPLYESEFFPANLPTATPGSPLAIFGDYRFYWIVDRTGFAVQILIEKYAEFDQTGYLMRERSDGMPVIKDAFRVLTSK